MQIKITGKPCTYSDNIAKLLASRFNLPYFNDTSFADTDIITDMNQQLSNMNDYVCSSILASKLDAKGISICLDSSLVSVDTTSADLHDLYLQEQSNLLTYGQDIYDPSNYDVYIVRSGMTDEAVVDFIVSIFVDGTIFDGGIYVPANMCIPSKEVKFDSHKLTYDKYETFEIAKLLSTYVLLDKVSMAKLFYNNYRLLKVDGMFKTLNDYTIGSVSDYYWWSDIIQDTTGVFKNSLMLARYCQHKGSVDADLVLEKLQQDGDPIKHLIKLGYSE